jgi:hypothetical protein
MLSRCKRESSLSKALAGIRLLGNQDILTMKSRFYELKQP